MQSITLTRDIWNFLTDAFVMIPECPSWLAEQVHLSWETVKNLPDFNETVAGEHARPSVEEKTVTGDYLNFLREQIELNARNDDWLMRLKSRLTALAPVVGKHHWFVEFRCNPYTAYLRINPETKEIIHFEVW